MILWLACGAAALLLLVSAAIIIRRQQRQKAALQLQLRLVGQRLEEANQTNAFLSGINQSFIHQAPTAMLLVDESSKVVFFNPAAQRQFELSSRHSGRPLIEVVRDHDLDQLVRQVLDGMSPAEGLEIRPPGQDLVLRANARRIGGDREPRGVAIVVEDLTELHRLEVVRREFVANVSHELRTPLATVKAMVDTLQMDNMADKARAVQYVRAINSEIDHLTTLIRDLLDLSRIESGRVSLQPRPLNICELVNETIDKLRPECERAGLLLECCQPDTAVMAIADPHRTQQVVLNLVHNAIKFTQAPGTVSVHVRGDDGYAQVTVQDTGVGIPEDDLPRIFERFYKVDKGRARQENPGTGLGLAIVKHLVSAMGGRVQVESKVGRGSSFSFTLPLASSAAPVLKQEILA